MFENLEKVKFELFGLADQISTVLTSSSTAVATTKQNSEDNRDHGQFVEEVSKKVEEKRRRLFPSVNLMKIDSKTLPKIQENLDHDVKQEIIYSDNDDDDDCNIPNSADLPVFSCKEEISRKVDPDLQEERILSSEQIIVSKKVGILRIKPPQGQGETYCPCTFCTRTFKTTENLMSHLRRHICEKPFICRFCSQESTTISNLVAHERGVHQKIKQKKKIIVCEICGKSFTNHSLKRHIMATHQGIKPFQCEICGRQFFTPGAHRQHYQRAHSDDRPFSCDKCPSTFKVRVDLQIHQKNVHKAARNKTHPRIPTVDYQPCDICGKKFPNEHILNVHKTRFHNDTDNANPRSSRPHKCTHPGCDWSFFTKRDLERHSFKHTGKRQFKCDKCPKSFVRRTNLIGHMDVHNEIRLISCNICGKGFSSRWNLKLHEKTHGKDKP